MKTRKKYFVLMNTRKFGFTVETNSFRIAKWFANLKLWTYSKIHNYVNGKSYCIFINDKRDLA